MSAILAIVGRPNVGKSTLFNRMTKTRQALVHDLPGVTRDRLYGRVVADERQFTVIDTGGFDPPADQLFAEEVNDQIQLALDEADVVLFLADGRSGINPADQEVADKLRRTNKPVIYAVNKIDSARMEDDAAEFYGLGVEHLHFISAAHGYGMNDLMDDILARLPEEEETRAVPGGAVFPSLNELAALEEPPEDLEFPEERLVVPEIRVALIGRPNVGKSSLLNALFGGPRVVVSDVPGTTRDAVDTPLVIGDKNYTIIDTAGIRRRGKVQRGIEKAGVFRSLRAIDRAHVVVCMIDAGEGITDQDLHLIGAALEQNRGLIIAINKWDLIFDDEYKRKTLEEQIERSFRFAPWAPILRMSVKSGRSVDKVLPTVDRVFEQYNTRLGTGRLNQALEDAQVRHAPPSMGSRRLKIFYGAQVAVRPSTIALVVNDPTLMHFSYRRYLTNELRRAMGLDCAPLKLILRERSGRKPKRRRRK